MKVRFEFVIVIGLVFFVLRFKEIFFNLVVVKEFIILVDGLFEINLILIGLIEVCWVVFVVFV